MSSSGVWTASVSDSSVKDVDPLVTTLTTAAEVIRPKSSLSMGVISDGVSIRDEKEQESIPFMDEDDCNDNDENDADESVHSCDTEGYYTTFHDFDGFQEVANEYKFSAELLKTEAETGQDHADSVKTTDVSDGVVYRKKPRSDSRPSPPRRHSSLVKDRDSVDTVKRESVDTVIDVSLDITDSDLEVAKHFPASSVSSSTHESVRPSLTSRYMIPSLCVVTPPVSDSNDASRDTSVSPMTSAAPNTDTSPDQDHDEEDTPVVSPVTTDRSDTTEDTADHDVVNRLSAASSSSVMTNNSGKLVSITPDIVKPVKENKTETQTETDEKQEEVKQVENDIVQSGSGSHLPDMLSHTPEMTLTHDTALDTVLQTSPVVSTPVSHDQPSAQQSVSDTAPKLRITSPFAAYKHITTPQHLTSESGTVKQNISSPSTLTHDQGEFVSGNTLVKFKHSEKPLPALNNRVVKDAFHLNSPKTRRELSFTGETVKSSLSVESGGGGGEGVLESSTLKRSDSYRNARTILSPDLSNMNRNRSPDDISPSNKIENATYVSFNNITSAKSSNSMENSFNTSDDSKDDVTNDKPKQNFFKNIRSQFSTLSLRRKSSKKHDASKSPQVTPNSKTDKLSRSSSFLKSPLNRTPDQPPRLTSTPISGDKSVERRRSSPGERRARSQAVSEWSSDQYQSPGQFRTAAMKNQTQMQQHYHQANTAVYGYVQQHHHLPPYHPPPHYATYTSPQSQASQRSSVSSIYGLYQRPGSVSSSGHNTAARVSPSSRVSSSSPPQSVSSDTCSSDARAAAACHCPMCYHSVSNPCQDCGCPSRSNTSSSLSLNNFR